MKRFFWCGAAAALACAARAGEWRVVRDIAGEAETAAVAAVTLDGHVFGNSLPGLADVRVLDGTGREVPRVIQPEREYVFEERHTPRAAKLKGLEQLPEGGLAVVCEIERTNAVALTRLTVRTPLRDYEQTVTLYVRDGEGGWRPVKQAEPLFDYSRFADVKKETVDLPALTNRLFRLVIGRADDRVFSSYTAVTEEAGRTQVKRFSVEQRPFRIDAVFFRDTERVAVAKDRRERMDVRGVNVTEDAGRKETVLEFEAGRQPVVGLALDPEQQNFERAVTVECSVAGGWRTVAEGGAARSRLPGVPPADRLELGFGEVRAERVRVRVRNDDNPPLTFGEGGVSLVRQAYRAVFIAEKGQRYRLAYGNPEVKAPPVYEQGVTAYLNSGRKAAEWRVAPPPQGEVTYGARVRLRQFLAKHGLSLLSVLVMAALAALILRAVRHVNK